MSATLLYWFSVSILISYVSAGCYQKRLCCPNKNNSCTALDDGVSHIPAIAATLRRFDLPLINDKDFVDPEEISKNSKRKPKRIPKQLRSNPEQTITNKPTTNQYKPISNLKFSSCYCDEYCVKYGDCCADYVLTCNVRDCVVENWSQWSDCIPDNRVRRCGSGIQTRVRRVISEAIGGGQQCPSLTEKKTCFKHCPRRASRCMYTLLLLRCSQIFNLNKNDLSFYCVKYKLEWINRNCIDPRFKPKLYKGNVICAECQPDSQLHQPDARCALDLDDGDTGFWKLLGSRSCNGIWTRQLRVDNCRCGKQFNASDSFLFV
uniref:SMB domain-containing protein n=1 Tax=Syphacia muris TaxID=451379 RepID=A0A0N5B016_9BILA